MANACGVDMTVAVAEAGGLGSFPCAALTDEKIGAGVAEIRSRTSKPINLNFFCHEPAPADPACDAAWLKRLAPYYAELGAEMPKLPLKASIVSFTEATCAVVEELRPAVVSFHFGLPDAALVARVKKAGCKVISFATTLREARFLAEHGVDAIIAQGSEAGGHRGMFIETDIATQIGTFALVQQIVTAVSVPVIAAGGISDAKSIAAAFALGAAGAIELMCLLRAEREAERRKLWSIERRWRRPKWRLRGFGAHRISAPQHTTHSHPSNQIASRQSGHVSSSNDRGSGLQCVLPAPLAWALEALAGATLEPGT
jgi:hypothetical protein